MQDLIIIGGGVIGLSVAYFAQRAGLSVTVLDRNPPESESCSTGNAGMVVPSHFVPLAAPGMIGMGLRSMLNPESPFYIRPRLDPDLISWCWRFFQASSRARSEASAPALAASQLDSRALYEQLATRDGLDFGLQKRGLMMLCASEESLQHELALKPAAARLGVALEPLTPEQARALNPGVDITCAGGVLFPLDCFLSPPQLLAALRAAILRGGGEIRHGVEVTGWDASGDAVRAVKTSVGDVSGAQYVLAAGSWSPRASSGLRVRLPMQAGKGYSITLEQPPAQLSVCAILVE
ncbi:MAG TPA: FAD-dependent oxidoreductase, partial [Thermoflexales bacterium]|nr:FAD-dependent oxidoreductase [Thermoflexales bacterium]